MNLKVDKPKNFLGYNIDIIAKSVRQAFLISDQIEIIIVKKRE